jgi:hypothetical protein
VSQVSIGATVNLINNDSDHDFTLNNIEGSQLNAICGSYYGLKLGLALGAGGTGFTSVNNSGVILRSNDTVLGLAKIDLSGVKINVKCLNSKNPNWKKAVRF